MPNRPTAPTNHDSVVILLRDELLTIGIPPRPAVLINIEAEMRKPAPNYGALEKIISHDVGVSAGLLKIANSAFFGFSGRVRSVQEALQILGLDTVASAIAALSLRKSFAHVPNMERFWDSSSCIAQISGWLATQIEFPEHRIKPEEAYTFGLFRDSGIAVLMANIADYIDILKAANLESSLPFTAIEDAEMGVNHAILGAKLAKEWCLPIEYATAIQFHHDSQAILGEDPPAASQIARYFIAISQLAEYLFQRLTGLNKTREWDKLGSACLSALNLAEQDTEILLKAVVANQIHLEHIH